MSECINTRDNRATIRWKLLTSVSALALTVTVSSLNTARAEDADRPLIWVELGGQMENVAGQGAAFAPAFLAANSSSPVLQSVTPLQAQKPPKFSFGEEGTISFQPEDSSWIFSAGLRIGRSGNARHVHHQTYNTFFPTYHSGIGRGGNRFIDIFSDTLATRKETHAVLDFSAGKDVGLGMFGKDSSSVVSLGVRFAQFTSKASFGIRARPEMHFKYLSFPSYHSNFKLPYYQTYHATGQATRNFRGVGPSLSWSGSAPFVGNQQDGELTFDWGANAAILFGKQKAHVRHQESSHFVTQFFIFNGGLYAGYQHPPAGHDTDRSVTVPNVGGSVGLSWRVQDFKVSMGYRADFFIGAMDTGIDAMKKSNMAFNGPYASISVGLGD